jgi:hypothetical protein
MASRKVHDIFAVEYERMPELPRWATRFLRKVQQMPTTAKPSVLLLSEENRFF